MRTIGVSGNRTVLLEGRRSFDDLDSALEGFNVPPSMIFIGAQYDDYEVEVFKQHILVDEIFYDIRAINDLDESRRFIFDVNGSDEIVRMNRNTSVTMAYLDPNGEDLLYESNRGFVTEYEDVTKDLNIRPVSIQEMMDTGYDESMIFLVGSEIRIIAFSGNPWELSEQDRLKHDVMMTTVIINNGKDGYPLIVDSRDNRNVCILNSNGTIGIVRTNNELLSVVDDNGNVMADVLYPGNSTIGGIGVIDDVLLIINETGLVRYDISNMKSPVLIDQIHGVLDSTDVVKAQ